MNKYAYIFPIVLVIILLGMFVFINGDIDPIAGITGWMTKYEGVKSESVDDTFETNTVSLWEPEKRTILGGLGITGNVSGNGTAKSYLVHGDDKTLINSYNLENESVSFENDCEETCSLDDLNQTEYYIRYELEGDVSYEVDSIDYSSQDMKKGVSSKLTPKDRIEVGKSVQWEGKVSSDKLELPEQAQNISVRDDSQRILQTSTVSSPPVKEENGSKQVDVSNYNDPVVSYTTPGPKSIEKKTPSGKQVTISASDELNYKDVLAHTEISESREITDTSQLEVYWKNENQSVDFNAYDTNNNSYIDKVEWTVPHLSNQTYILSTSSGPASGEEWTMFQYDLENTGHTTNTAEEIFSAESYKTGGWIMVSPTVANGYVYVGSGDNNVYQLNASTMEKVNSYTTGDYADCSPTVANGYVYVGSYDDSVYQLDATDMSLVNNYTTGGDVWSPPTVVNGYVYVGSVDNNVYQLDASTMNKVNSYETGGRVGTSPAVANGYVYVGSTDNNVYQLNASTMNKVNSYETGRGVYSSPAVANGYVYVGSVDDKVYQLDATDMSLVNNYTTGGMVTTSPAVANGYIYVGSNDNNVYQLDATDMSLVNNYTTGDNADTPVVANGYVYVGSRDNNVYQLDATNMSLVNSYSTGDHVFSSPAVANGYVYVGSFDDKVYKLGSDPIVNLISPSNSSVGALKNDFIANVTDVDELKNATLHIWNSSNDLVNETAVNISGTWNETNITGSVPSVGNYTWNVKACDNQGYCEWGEEDYSFEAVPTLVFSDSSYSYNVKRVFDTIDIEISNNHNSITAEDLKVNVSEESIPVSVIGPGSEMVGIDLNTSDSFNVTLGINARNFNSEDLSIRLNITSDNLAGEKYREVNLSYPAITPSNYNWTISPGEWNINLSNVSSESELCSDMKKNYTITNTGAEPLADFSLALGGNLSENVYLKPSLGKTRIDSGESVEFTAYFLGNSTTSNGTARLETDAVIYSKNATINYSNSNTNWVSEPSYDGNYTVTKESFLCVNRPDYSVSFDVPSKYSNTSNSELIMAFENTCGDVQEFDTYVDFNGNQIKQWIQKTLLEDYTISFNSGLVQSGVNTLDVTSENYQGRGHFCANAHNTLRLSSSTSFYCDLRCIQTEKQESNCSDGKDNDCDGMTDCEDPDCCGSGCYGSDVCDQPEVCDNGVDDDSDGLTDCSDIMDCCETSACNTSVACTNYDTLIDDAPIDDTPPGVTDLIPSLATIFPVNTSLEISANVTDSGTVDTVLANITKPDSTVSQITLTQVGSTEKYNASYQITTGDNGRYNITYIANDTSGNVNDTETTWFEIKKIILNNPTDGQIGISTSPTLNVTVTDPNGDSMNVTFYDASDDSQIGTNNNVSNSSDATVTWSGLNGSTTYEWYVNVTNGSDTIQSEVWNFTTLDSNPLSVKNLDYTPSNAGLGNQINFTVNVTDGDGVDSVLLGITHEGTENNHTMDNVSSIYSFTKRFWKNGTYTYRVYAHDTLGNLNNTEFDTLDIYANNITYQVHTMKDEYTENETVNLTDPPGVNNEDVETAQQDNKTYEEKSMVDHITRILGFKNE